jgi:mRNA interferase HigB
MRLFTARTLQNYSVVHADVRDELTNLIRILEVAAWTDANHLKNTCPFPSRPIGAKRVVFNLKGNHYRVICEVQYALPNSGKQGRVFVHFIGTHAEYDRVDADTVRLS